MTGGMAAMLLGMLGKSHDPAAMNQVFSMINDPANDGQLLDNSAALVGGPTDTPMSMLGGRFLSNIFGTRGSAVNDALAKSSGMRIGSISTLLQIAAPLVLSVIGKRVRDTGLNASSLGRLLQDERDSIQRSAPPGVYNALGVEQRTSPPLADYEVPKHEVPRADQTPIRTQPREPESTGRSWFWPAAATVAALALLWGMWPRHREPEITFRDTSRTAVSGGEVAAPIAPPVTMGIARVMLPGGDSLDVGEASNEGMIVGFLRDPAKSPDKTSWFVLDRMQFETNSATLKPESQAQIQNVAKILKAYPQASVKIGGYTDNVGSEAANKKLSQERAQSARKAIIAAGIPSSRVAAEGYGSAHPLADNSTDAGRAQNRRIALLITKK
jgi:outer membrane protein OmpA-like peptidoglycan-associated protein